MKAKPNSRLKVISQNDLWKMVILLMGDGQWVTIPYLQEQTKLKRARLRDLLDKGITAGIIERSYEEHFQQPSNRAFHSHGHGWLYRKKAYYRLRMDKIKIKLE